MIEGQNVLHGSVEVSHVKGLLFDVDGTLSDTDDRLIERVVRWLKPFRWLFKDHNPRRFARGLVMGIETPANLIYGLADKLGLDNFLSKIFIRRTQRKRTQQHPKHRFLLIEGIEEMLQRLSEHYAMGVVSARDAATTLHFLEQFDLLKYFNVVVTSQSCNRTKPFPDPVVYAAEQLGLRPENCIMIGDTTVDVRAGRSAGAQTIAVLCGFGTQQELLKSGADLIVENTPDITALIIEV